MSSSSRSRFLLKSLILLLRTARIVKEFLLAFSAGARRSPEPADSEGIPLCMHNSDSFRIVWILRSRLLGR